jgi:hypothetical protein
MRKVCLGVVMTACTVAWAAQPPQLADVLARAAQYVASVEAALPVMAADEEYAQTAESNKMLGGSTLGVGTGQAGAMIEGHTVRTRRKSRSELLLVRRNDAPFVWSGVRSTLEVDGKSTEKEPGRLERLAAAPADLDRAWPALVDESRTIQIGEPVRGVHAPWTTLALLRADQQPRVEFKKDGEETINGVRVWKVSFVERKTPSLLRSTGNAQVPSRGIIWLDPATGQALRTKLELGSGLNLQQLRVEVDYALDAGLGLPVPVTMKERHENERGNHAEAKSTFRHWRKVAPR